MKVEESFRKKKVFYLIAECVLTSHKLDTDI